MLPTKKQWNSWSLPSKYTAIGLLLGIVAFLVTLISPFVSSDYVIKNITNKEIRSKEVHSLPIDFKLNIAKGNIGDVIEGGLILQAREAPILLNKNIVISEFTFEKKYFDLKNIHVDDVSLNLKDVQVNKLSLEKVGEEAEFLVTVKPSLLYVSPHYSVWNLESARGTKVGEVTLLVKYDTLNQEKSIKVIIPIRLS